MLDSGIAMQCDDDITKFEMCEKQFIIKQCHEFSQFDVLTMILCTLISRKRAHTNLRKSPEQEIIQKSNETIQEICQKFFEEPTGLQGHFFETTKYLFRNALGECVYQIFVSIVFRRAKGCDTNTNIHIHIYDQT